MLKILQAKPKMTTCNHLTQGIKGDGKKPPRLMPAVPRRFGTNTDSETALTLVEREAYEDHSIL